MSQFTFIASNSPLRKLKNPHVEQLSVNEAVALGMELPEMLSGYIDQDKPGVLLRMDAEESLGDIVIREVKWDRDYTEGLWYNAIIEWSYTDERAEKLILYIKKHLESAKLLELWHVWLDSDNDIIGTLEIVHISVDDLTVDILSQYLKDNEGEDRTVRIIVERGSVEEARAEWLIEVKNRLRRKNQILFTQDSAFLSDLSDLIGKQTHRTMVLWAFEFAEKAVNALLKKYPYELRPQEALSMSRAWAQGKAKMPAAQKAILGCHAFAKEITSLHDIALCHAIGQACGTVHANGHAIGFPIYELTAIIRQYGVEDCRELVEIRKRQYMERLMYWKEHEKDISFEWAGFL